MSDDLVKRLRRVSANPIHILGTPGTTPGNVIASAAADRIEELQAQRNFAQRQVVAAETKLDKAVDKILDAASAYIKEQYGIGALSNPVDRERIITELKKEPQP